ncbi:MAG: MFS transporter [Syntrophus sp. SKADARSKE-3]|nr:MFS transporter [Syntrophus sp. SKADARSKE-3]
MPTWKKNLYAIWIAQFFSSVGLTMVTPFLPFYIRELGVTGSDEVNLWSGIIFAAPFLLSSLMQPIWGVLGDRHGHKPMVVRAMLGLGLANALMSFSGNIYQLLVLRLFQGFLSGFFAPSMALVASGTPRENTGFALGMLQSAFVSGMVVGPFIGGILVHFSGYRSNFLFTGLCCFMGAQIVIWFVQETFVPLKNKSNYTDLKKNIRSVFMHSELRTLFIIMLMVQASIHSVSPFLSLYVEFLDFSQEYVDMMTGLVFGIAGITSTIASPMWGKKVDEIGFSKVLRISLAGILIFMLPQAFVTSAYQLIFLRAGLGIFIAGAVPAINAFVQRSTNEGRQGGIHGIFQSGFLFGSMAGPLLGGFLSAAFGLRAIFVITTAFLCVTMFLERMYTNRIAKHASQ